MKAEVRYVSGQSFLGRAETNHWVPMDTTTDAGGFGAAGKPLELVLLALGGCTGMDVVHILRKKRVPFIHLVYRFGGVAEKDGLEAARLSQEKYCVVSAMLAKACPITYECKFEL